MFGKKVKIKFLSLFSFNFFKFYFQCSKRNFIKHPYKKGVKNIFKYFFVFNCIRDINEIFNVKISIEHFNKFSEIFLMCKDWENGIVNPYLMVYLNKKETK